MYPAHLAIDALNTHKTLLQQVLPTKLKTYSNSTLASKVSRDDELQLLGYSTSNIVNVRLAART